MPRHPAAANYHWRRRLPFRADARYSPSMETAANKAIFLDRDGVINVDDGYTHRLEDFALMPGAAAAIRRANEAGYKVMVVTNQGGIGLGYYSEDDMRCFHDHMQHQLAEASAVITDIAWCPHHPRAAQPENRNCSCRKPSPKMILDLAERHNIALAKSAMIGDRETDVAAGEAAGMKAYLFDGTDLDKLMRNVLAELNAGDTPHG